jgi:uncharacterized protein (DUF3084 family)
MPDKCVRSGNVNPFWVMAERQKMQEEKEEAASKKNNTKVHAELEQTTRQYKKDKTTILKKLDHQE